MKLEGAIYRENRLMDRRVREVPDGGQTFVVNLDRCLLALCKDLGIPIPIWMNRNTREFAHWRQTAFTSEQFDEKTHFDRFQIRLSE